MAAAAPGRRSPLAAPPAPRGRPAASWAAASWPGAAPQQMGPGAGGRRALRRGRRARGADSCRAKRQLQGRPPPPCPAGPAGRGGGCPALPCSALLRPALPSPGAGDERRGGPLTVALTGRGARPVRTSLRRLPRGAAEVVSLGRRQPFRALSGAARPAAASAATGMAGAGTAPPPRGRDLSGSQRIRGKPSSSVPRLPLPLRRLQDRSRAVTCLLAGVGGSYPGRAAPARSQPTSARLSSPQLASAAGWPARRAP